MKQPEKPLDLLVIAPHPDDAEISVGGTLIACRKQGLAVGIIDLTDGEPTPLGSPEIRSRETAAADAVLRPAWRANLGLPNRSLENTLKARRGLAEVIRLTRPRLLLAPYWEDAHPDHTTASRLADDARFTARLTKTDMRGEPHWTPRIYYFWSIHLRIHPKPAFVFDVSDSIEEKMAAVACYHSQLVAGRSTAFPTLLDDIKDRARYWGWTIGKAFGEPLACREEIGVSRLDALL